MATRLLKLAFAAIWLLAACSASAQSQPVQVRVDSGALTGASDGQIERFQGVPYAQPPVGALRWRPPQSLPPWTDARPAQAFGASCMQPAPMRGAPTGSPAAQMSEDCLTLNVWAPAASGSPRPVMVWLHGGGNDRGTSAGAYYDGSAFARDGVVLVSLNYRLGGLGFFAHPALTKEAGPGEPTADYGLMDQIAALQWVRRNIAAFGGDPGNVTLFGESAGGEDVLLLMSAPSARGLFAKAIVESGGEWNVIPDLAKAEREGVAVAAKAGLPGDAVTAAQLRALPASAFTGMGEDEDSGPSVDGRLLPESALAAFRNGHAAPVPLIIGTNGNEGSLLGDAPVDPARLFQLTPEELKTLRGAYGQAAADDAAFSRLIWRDGFFAGPSRWAAAHQSAHAPVWLYRFSYILSPLRSRRTGADHGSEIPFVFDSSRSPFLSDDDRKMINTMHGCWVAFARTGKPDCPGAGPWPAYDPKSEQLMAFGDQVGPAPVPDRQALDLLNAKLPSMDGR